MFKEKTRSFQCSNCGRETYSHYEECLNCKEKDTVKLKAQYEKDSLRKYLHNTIDVMTDSQLENTAKWLGLLK